MYFLWLRAFNAVAREGGVTAAARRLNISQSTVTSQVKALEDRFGTELLMRSGRGVRLTEAGEKLHVICQDLLASYDEAIAFLGDSMAGHLRIGGVGAPPVIELAAAYSRRFPDTRLTLNVDHTDGVLARLNDHAIDVAILAHQEKSARFHTMLYQRYRIVAFVGAGHRLSRRRSIGVGELAGEAMVLRDHRSKLRQILDHVLGKEKVRPGRVLEVNSRETMREAVLHGFGIGVVTEREYIADRRLHPARIEHPDLFVEFHVTCLAKRRARAPIAAFFEAAAALRETGGV